MQRKVVTAAENDEYGQPIVGDEADAWEDVCRCRCDDNVTKWYSSQAGSVYRTNYHAVCDGKIAIDEGDIVRCLENGEVRGEGEVYTVKKCNFFGYTELYF